MESPYEHAFAEFERMVDSHGWAIRHVLGSATVSPFSYTVGLTSRGWDEIVITGLTAEVADVFIRNAVDEQGSRGPFRPGDRTGALTESGSVAFVRVEDRSGLDAAIRILRTFEALQLVWPDSSDQLPWDSDYRNPPEAQPLLGAAPGSNHAS